MKKPDKEDDEIQLGSAIAAVVVTITICVFALFIGVTKTQEKREAIRQKLQAPYYIPGDRATIDFTVPKDVTGIHIGDCKEIPIKDTDKVSGWRCPITLERK